jgi:hypothetical protein
MRCSVGAAGVAVQLLVDGIGAGPTFAAFAGVTAVLSSLLVAEWFYGEGLKTERRERLRAKEEQKKAVEVEKVEILSKK